MARTRNYRELGDETTTGVLFVRDTLEGPGVAAQFVDGNPNGVLPGEVGQLAIDVITRVVYQSAGGLVWTPLITGDGGWFGSAVPLDGAFNATVAGAPGSIVSRGVTYPMWTMARSRYYTTLTIEPGVYFNTNGYHLHVRDVCTRGAGSVVGRLGNDGVSGDIGTAGGAILTGGSLGSSGAGGTGGTGSGASSAGSVPSASPGSFLNPIGRGGDGGQNSSGTPGSPGPALTVLAFTQGDLSNIMQAVSGRQLGASAFNGAGGGGGGRGSPTGSTRGGGGGGGGAPVVYCAREDVQGAGAFISARGGAGGSGQVGGSGGGGGGGGAQLTVVIGMGDLDGILTDVSGGPGGVHGGVLPAASGLPGNAGQVFKFKTGS